MPCRNRGRHWLILAVRRLPSVAMSGLSMMLGDLATIVQYKLPVKLIVFNNRSLGMVKLEMEVAGLPGLADNDARSRLCPHLPSPMGNGGLMSTIRMICCRRTKAFASDGPVLVNILTTIRMPWRCLPKIEFTQMLGFAQTMPINC